MKTRRPWLTVVLALLWSVATLGFCQFMFSWTRPVVLESSLFLDWTAWDELTCWVRSGCGRPSGTPWPWLGWTGCASVLLAATTLRSLPPVRTWRRERKTRVRTLMAVIAIMAFVYSGGREVWHTWERWGRYAYLAERHAFFEKFSLAVDPDEFPDGVPDEEREQDLERKLACSDKHRIAKDFYRRAMWRPWIEVDPDRPKKAGPPCGTGLRSCKLILLEEADSEMR